MNLLLVTQETNGKKMRILQSSHKTENILSLYYQLFYNKNEMMNISEKLKNLVEILSHRGVGHTTLLRTGTDTYNKPFIQLGMSHSQLNESALFENIQDHGQLFPVSCKDLSLNPFLGVCLRVLRREHRESTLIPVGSGSNRSELFQGREGCELF